MYYIKKNALQIESSVSEFAETSNVNCSLRSISTCTSRLRMLSRNTNLNACIFANGKVFEVSLKYYFDVKSFFLLMMILRYSRESITNEKINSMSITIEVLKTECDTSHDFNEKSIWKEILYRKLFDDNYDHIPWLLYHFGWGRIRETCRHKNGSSKVILTQVQMQRSASVTLWSTYLSFFDQFLIRSTWHFSFSNPISDIHKWIEIIVLQNSSCD